MHEVEPCLHLENGFGFCMMKLLELTAIRDKKSIIAGTNNQLLYTGTKVTMLTSYPMV
jgi:hypothetical protein